VQPATRTKPILGTKISPESGTSRVSGNPSNWAERSLIQTIGRAARHINGAAILYADRITDSMRRAMDETARRRANQVTYNAEHGITPRGVIKRVRDLIDGVYDAKGAREERRAAQAEAVYEAMGEKELTREVKRLEKEMLEAARNLEFERAAQLRDELKKLKERLFVGLAA
jgi:excinuclease ABC subunit B